MDALDVEILRTMGVKPFVARTRLARALKPAAIARALGRNVQVVKDRIARMEADGVIRGYRIFPNLRHCGLGLALFHFRADAVPQKDRLTGLVDVDGLVGVLWFYGGDLCVDVSYTSAAERARRLGVVQKLVQAEEGPFPLYERAFPEVERELTPLDWRIVRALLWNARRPLPEVAREVGVTVKTVRSRLDAMRRQGAVEEYADVDYERMAGVIPFNLGVWFEPDADPTSRLLERFRERYLIHFPPSTAHGPPTFLAQLFAYTTAEVQSLAAEALAEEGVVKVATLLPTGGYYNDDWLAELVDARADGERRPLPKPVVVSPKREIRS